jgi:hypothetical protein
MRRYAAYTAVGAAARDRSLPVRPYSSTTTMTFITRSRRVSMCS